MLGLMQQRPLLISSLLDYAERYHAGTEIVSRSVEGPIHRSNWGEVATRARQIANALHRQGVVQGERIATLAWNHDRHLEIYFGVTCSGAVLHTVNPRLFPEQVRFIVDDAEASYVFFDVAFAELVKQLAPQLPSVRGYVALCTHDALPSIDVPNLLCYEDLLAAETADYAWPRFDENTASALCYTSGTTGNPKGVLQSHRSAVLHSFSLMAADTMAISARDSLLLCAPLFHVNCWGIPFAAASTGAKLVLPGMKLDGASLFELIRDEGITFLGAVPTVWLNLFAWMEQHLDTLDHRGLRLKRVLSGGSAVPRVVIEKVHAYFGATMLHAWGMTEMSPLGTCGSLLSRHVDLDLEQRMPMHLKQGRTIYGAEVRIVDEEGHELPRDGNSVGEVQVRGPWVLSGYFKGAGGKVVDDDGWFRTGDVARMDADGFLTITDRAKDVIKSGGEWISSIDIENLVVSHPAVMEAAVIAARHARWQERPLLLVHRRQGAEVTKDEILAFLSDKIAKWWLPDDVVFVDGLPHTATGKLLKTRLREQYSDWLERA
ncbi:MAG TPA: long-chain-fatty-acid--CoA ligase [Acetobacteraceae bacterium]|nr:long-chain-fatty-acid--CoA ligase [Acetobacteraceae bacterium]